MFQSQVKSSRCVTAVCRSSRGLQLPCQPINALRGVLRLVADRARCRGAPRRIIFWMRAPTLSRPAPCRTTEAGSLLGRTLVWMPRTGAHSAAFQMWLAAAGGWGARPSEHGGGAAVVRTSPQAFDGGNQVREFG